MPPSTPRLPNRKPVQRLASIGNPTPGRRNQPKSTNQSRSNTCPNLNCPALRIVDDDDKKVCTGCGAVISDSNIVAEVTSGETSAGVAIVQGTFVGADQSHGRNFGPGQRGGMESREVTVANVRDTSASLLIPFCFLKILPKLEFKCSDSLLPIISCKAVERGTSPQCACILLSTTRLQPNHAH